MTGKWIKMAGVAVLVASAAGCANNDELKAQVQKAMQMAESAQSTANSAQSTAQSAQATAEQAMSAAQEAQACCQANSKRIERMFKTSMRK
ncbi:MAG: Lpp/OprI family alanine-zipper lipoprotein [Salinisphaera sp.]|nr:Lpp/OprI family alanine-zipper lipoprotein [Salinisphaera sp.]MDN5938232.1 Lpp/OprI family alanine-zipper lipoprotein [Salinisphaera sp.]